MENMCIFRMLSASGRQCGGDNRKKNTKFLTASDLTQNTDFKIKFLQTIFLFYVQSQIKFEESDCDSNLPRRYGCQSSSGTNNKQRQFGFFRLEIL